MSGQIKDAYLGLLKNTMSRQFDVRKGRVLRFPDQFIVVTDDKVYRFGVHNYGFEMPEIDSLHNLEPLYEINLEEIGI